MAPRRRLPWPALALALLPGLAWPLAAPAQPGAGADVAGALGELPQRHYLPSVSRGFSQIVDVTLDPAEAAGVVGREQWYEVRVHDVRGLLGFNITVRYDPERLRVMDEDPGRYNTQIAAGDWPPAGERVTWPVAFNESGTMYIPLFTTGPPLDGTAVVARFRVQPRQAGEAGLRFEQANLDLGLGSQRLSARRHGARLGATVGLRAPPADQCAPVPDERFDRLSIEGRPLDRPAEAHPDLNLGLRGAEPADAVAGLVDYGGDTDPRAPKLAGLLAGLGAGPRFISVMRLQGWDWSAMRPGPVLTEWPATLVGVPAEPGQLLTVPDSGYHIGDGFEVLLLYAAPGRVTLKYTREDGVVEGYTLHVEGVCVAPGLQAAYDRAVREGRRRLPALRSGQAFGRAADVELRFAIRDSGAFMDPRSRKDWWPGLP